MKSIYTTPIAEEILLRMEETICGVSGQKFQLKDNGAGTTFDNDSD